MKRKNLYIKSFIAVCIASTVVGCTQNSENKVDEVTTSSEQSESAGNFGKTENGKPVQIINNTDMDIIYFASWPVGKVFELTNELSELGNIPAGEKATWTKPDMDPDYPLSYIQIALRDGTSFVLRDIDLESIDENEPVSIEYKEGTGYLTYTNKDKKFIDLYQEQKSKENEPLKEDYNDDQAVIGIPSEDEE